MSPFEREKALRMGIQFLLKSAAEEDQKAAMERDRGNLECAAFHQQLAEANYRMVSEIQAISPE